MRFGTLFCFAIVFTACICVYAQITPQDAEKVQAQLKNLLLFHKKSDKDGVIDELKKIPGLTAGDIKNAVAGIKYNREEPNGAEVFSGVYVPTEEDHVTYRILIPQDYDPVKPMQLLIAFPDENSTAEICVQTWKTVTKDCFVASPEKFKNNWENSPGRLPVIFYVLKDIKKKYNIDDNRVYIAGFGKSTAAVWSTVLAMPDCFASFAVMAGMPPDKSDAFVNIAGLPVYMSANADAKGIEAVRAAEKKLTQLKIEHSYSEPEGPGGGFSAGEAQKAFLWMSGKTRNPEPQSISLNLNGTFSRMSTYWLNVDSADPDAVITASVKNNTVDLTSTGVKQVTLYLNEHNMDFSKTLIVKANGKTAYSGRAAEDIQTVCECLFNTKDRHRLYAAKVVIAIAK